MTHAHGLCEPLREAMQPWQVLLAVLIYHCLEGRGGGGESSLSQIDYFCLKLE